MILYGDFKEKIKKITKREFGVEMLVLTNDVFKEFILENPNGLTVPANPTDKFLDKARSFASDRFYKGPFKFIVSIGGGSVIDVGKILSVLFEIPHIVVPTTCGSGSEATSYAVIIEKEKKETITNKEFLPKYVVYDEYFLKEIDHNKEAIALIAGVFDVLCHCVESYLSPKSTPVSEKYVHKAINLWKRFSWQWLDGQKKASLEMFEAAFYAGKAIDITQTGICHAVSYPLTTKYGIPHGLAAASMLATLIFYIDQLDKKAEERFYQLFSKKERYGLLGLISIYCKMEEMKKLFKKIDIEYVMKEAKKSSRFKNSILKLPPKFIYFFNYVK